jgi:hypothetical protein
MCPRSSKTHADAARESDAIAQMIAAALDASKWFGDDYESLAMASAARGITAQCGI